MAKFVLTGHAITDGALSIQPPVAPFACWVSFGGNVGDVKSTFDAALALLSLHSDIQIERRSGLYRSAPMGAQAGYPFLNSVCGLSTCLPPGEILSVLQSVENQLGRVRDVRWGPRTIDLDLLSHGTHEINTPDLIVPHPALAYRRFVLDPLMEIDPDWNHPQSRLSVEQMLARLKCRPLRVTILDVNIPQIEELAGQLHSSFPNVRFAIGAEDSNETLAIQLMPSQSDCRRSAIDLRHSPGCMLERLTSAFTAIFDVPERISDW